MKLAPQLANLGVGVWIGNKEACDEHGGEFTDILHVWHSCNLTHRCDHVAAGKTEGLVVEYLDGQSLTTANKTIDEIATFSRQAGKLLIHCFAGTYRSPTLALIALRARGVDIFQAMADIQRAMWTGYAIPRAAHFHDVPVREILEWSAKSGQNTGNGPSWLMIFGALFNRSIGDPFLQQDHDEKRFSVNDIHWHLGRTADDLASQFPEMDLNKRIY